MELPYPCGYYKKQTIPMYVIHKKKVYPHTQPIKKATYTEHIYLPPATMPVPKSICYSFKSHIYPTYPTMPIAVLHTQPCP